MMRVQLIGHFEPCMTEIYLHIDARMADYMATHPYYRMTHPLRVQWRGSGSGGNMKGYTGKDKFPSQQAWHGYQ